MGENPSSRLLGRFKGALDVIATMMVIAVAGVMLAKLWNQPVQGTRSAPAQQQPQRPSEGPLPSEPLSLTGAAVKGSPTAKVAIVEYSDFQCPFCAKFATTGLAELESEYISTGKVLFAFRHLPLEQIHPAAVHASTSTECARRQGKFWEMHDRIFRNPQQLAVENLTAHALELGLDKQAFSSCMNGDGLDAVRSDMTMARALRVTGTPTFFVGTVQADGRIKVTDRLVGAQALSHFRPIVDGLLDGN